MLEDLCLRCSCPEFHLPASTSICISTSRFNSNVCILHETNGHLTMGVQTYKIHSYNLIGSDIASPLAASLHRSPDLLYPRPCPLLPTHALPVRQSPDRLVQQVHQSFQKAKRKARSNDGAEK